MPNSLKSRLKKLEHQGLLSEKDLNRIIVIPDNATNGDMIKALFPEAIIEEREYGVVLIALGRLPLWRTYIDWWNAPYKENKEKYHCQQCRHEIPFKNRKDIDFNFCPYCGESLFGKGENNER